MGKVAEGNQWGFSEAVQTSPKSKIPEYDLAHFKST